jgi:hypothetical protein
VALPTPEPGLVIGYSYLWKREALAGQQEGRKDRPCAIILTKVVEPGGDIRVTVAPISHSPPANSSLAIELSQAVAAHLGLDSQHSWVHFEVNQFWWPGPDLRPISRNEIDPFAYGFLPPRLFKKLSQEIAACAAALKLGVTQRDDAAAVSPPRIKSES